MYGIWGYSGKYTSIKKLQKMANISHLEQVIPNIFLGHHNTLHTDTNIIFSVINGRINNYKELLIKYKACLKTSSDCEIVSYLYKLIGPYELCRELDGEFAIAIIDYNSRTKTYKRVLIRDTLGKQPLFYNAHSFSSEMKGLIGITTDIKVFPPGHFSINNILHKY